MYSSEKGSLSVHTWHFVKWKKDNIKGAEVWSLKINTKITINSEYWTLEFRLADVLKSWSVRIQFSFWTRYKRTNFKNRKWLREKETVKRICKTNKWHSSPIQFVSDEHQPHLLPFPVLVEYVHQQFSALQREIQMNLLALPVFDTVIFFLSFFWCVAIFTWKCISLLSYPITSSLMYSPSFLSPKSSVEGFVSWSDMVIVALLEICAPQWPLEGTSLLSLFSFSFQ